MKKENLCETVIRHILDLLFKGELKPGDRVPEEGIAEQLGISRTPIREALRRLGQDGLVTIYPRRYAEITNFDTESLEKIGLIRIELLALAARLAIRQGSNSDFDKLFVIAERYKAASQGNSLGRKIMEDEAFYHELAFISGNEHLQRLLEELAVKVRFIQFTRAQSDSGAPAAPGEHAEILDGLYKRDIKSLEKAIRSHLGDFYNIDPQILT